MFQAPHSRTHNIFFLSWDNYMIYRNWLCESRYYWCSAVDRSYILSLHVYSSFIAHFTRNIQKLEGQRSDRKMTRPQNNWICLRKSCFITNLIHLIFYFNITSIRCASLVGTSWLLWHQITLKSAQLLFTVAPTKICGQYTNLKKTSCHHFRDSRRVRKYGKNTGWSKRLLLRKLR